MMGLKEIGARLPPGFRFYPTDEELVCHYLSKKAAIDSVTTVYKDDAEALKNKGMSLVEIDLHTVEPWQLPEAAKLNATEWYFFNFRDRKYATGFRTNRATAIGYWKATGKDRVILDPSTRSMVGMRKTLVFYKNRAPNGIKTGWIMHEFRLETPHLPPKEDWVLCRVFHKTKVSSDNHNCSSNLSFCQPNGALLPYVMGQNEISSFCSTQNSNMLSNNLELLNNSSGNDNYNAVSAQDERNPATAGSSVTEMTSVEGGGDKCRGDYDFLWDMNLEEINSLAPSNEQAGTLHDHMDTNSLSFF